jgi:hypothetical protein
MFLLQFLKRKLVSLSDLLIMLHLRRVLRSFPHHQSRHSKDQDKVRYCHYLFDLGWRERRND